MRYDTNKIVLNQLPDGAYEIRAKIDAYSDVQPLEDILDGKKTYTLEIKEKRKSRSLTANAYAWKLCREIGLAMTPPIPAEEIYKQAVKDYGVTQIYPVRNDCIEEATRLFEDMGLGNATDVIGDCKKEGYKYVIFYYGSSHYDNKEMNKFISGLVADAHDVGVQTLTPREIEELKAMWN